MTVINAMKFNKDQGAIVSDEQSSFGRRKEDTARKVAKLYDKSGTLIITGGAGLANINKEATDSFIKRIEPSQSFETALNYFGQIFNQIVNKYVSSEMYKRFGNISIEEAITGKLKTEENISNNVLDAYFNTLNQLKSEYGSSIFLALGKDKGRDIELHAVEGTSPTPIKLSTPYQSIGTGADISSLELSKFASELTREQRENIDPVEGLVRMLYATHLSSKINHGVGGIPEIAMINNNKIIMPGENNCQLSKEISIAGIKGLLRPEYVKEAIDALFLKNQGFEEINKAMWQEAKDNKTYDALDLFLRGYKV